MKSKQKLENYKSKLIEYKQINANLQNTIEDLERALTQEKQHNHDFYEQVQNEYKEKELKNQDKLQEIDKYYQEKLVKHIISLMFIRKLYKV